MRSRLLAVRGRRRIAAALALLVAVAVVAALVAGVGSSSPHAATNSSAAPGATTVQRRDLVETDTESGTLSYANPQTVYNRLSGTITWLPSVGRVIEPGQTLFKVGGEPVILMSGTTPAYRDLTSSDGAGQDILELNRNLVSLGFNPDGIEVDDTWQAATTAGVEAFQASLGETQTGTLKVGQVVFLPGDQLISTVEGTLGSTQARDPASSNSSEFVDLRSAPTTPTRPTSPTKRGKSHKPGGKNKLTELEALIALLKAEIAEMKAGSAKPGRSSASGHRSSTGGANNSKGNNNSSNGANNNPNGSSNSNGNGGGTATAILQTTSTQLVVTVDLDASKQSEAKVGEPVTVEMPSGNTVNGKITAVSPVASSSSSNNGSGSGNGNGNNNNSNNNNSNNSSGSTIPVTIALSSRQSGAGLDQASVSVNFAEAKANNVLSVPVTALLATAGGGYAVQEAAAPHSLIPVTTGLFAAGYVQISGAGINPGMQVTDSQG